MSDELYKKPKGVSTRWASAENPLGIKGGAAKSNNGRKGSPAVRPLAAGQTVVLAQAEGTSGMIRHIWITLETRDRPEALRGFKLRFYWDGSETPAADVPLGDFFCANQALLTPFENAFFSNPEGRSFNCTIPMPFKTGMKITVSNETDIQENQFFYQIDYTIGDKFDDAMYFHAFYNREPKTAECEDYTVLPKVTGAGRYLGASFGVTCNPLMKGTWWGEGEVKCYIDGDGEYPTLAGTGTEDYIGTGWGLGKYCNMYQGCLVADFEQNRYAFYRLHGPDPVFFDTDIRITVQQIAWTGPEGLDNCRKNGLKVKSAGDTGYLDYDAVRYAMFERFDDDWSSVAYFYLDRPE